MSENDNEIEELPDPEDWTEMKNSRYLYAADLKGRDQTLTISAVKNDLLPDRKHPGKKKKMGVIYFSGEVKGLGLNTTNLSCFREMFGPKCQSWKGKRVTLYPTTVKMPKPGVRGTLVDRDCIRVRGSPDIAESITFLLELSGKAPQKVTLQKMVQKGQAPAAKPQPEPPPPDDAR